MSDAQAGQAGGGGPPGHVRVGSVICGKWQVDARIGTGGMATVYAVTHRNGHRAALKLLHTQLSRDPPTRARFLREGYAANSVGHPGVVGVLDDGVAEDGCAFLVLELLEGETMEARRLRMGGRLPIDEALDIGDAALAALAAAHLKGIIHRDVKPDNVFLTTDGKTKLLDFGLARITSEHAEITKTGVTIGTPEFMPPEQASGRRDAVDPRSDVWGLGATLFTSITGRYVHEDATSLREQLVASATRRSKPIRHFAPHVTLAIANVLDRALELEMDDRWPSANEMKDALQQARGARRTGYVSDSATLPTASLTRSSERVASSATDETELPSSDDDTHSGDWPTSIREPLGPLPAPSTPPMPPMRSPLLTPSGEHDTMPKGSPAMMAAADPHAATIASTGEDDGLGALGEPETPALRMGVEHAIGMEQPSTMPVSIPPPAYAQALPDPAPEFNPAFLSYPPQASFAPAPGGSFRAIVAVAVVLLALCAAMGAYVLWRSSLLQ